MLLQCPWFNHWLLFPMILLWLLCVGVTGQDFCSSPGHLPAPTMFLNLTSAQEGDTVLAQCSEFPNLHFTKVVFCKDGMDLSSQKFKPGQISYTLLLNTSMRGSGSYSCGYQRKNEKNQMANSQFSAPVQLNITERLPSGSVTDQPEKPPGWRLNFILGIAVGSFLILVLVTYLLMNKVACKQRHQREQGLNRSSENMGPDDLVQYAAISKFGTGRVLRPQETETATYAVIGKVRGRPS